MSLWTKYTTAEQSRVPWKADVSKSEVPSCLLGHSALDPLLSFRAYQFSCIPLAFMIVFSLPENLRNLILQENLWYVCRVYVRDTLHLKIAKNGLNGEEFCSGSSTLGGMALLNMSN